MASSPTDAPTPSRTAFALREVTACWNQGYEALTRGDLDQLAALLDVAGEHLAAIGEAIDDDAEEARLRREALTARGRLEHGMREGLHGLADELATSRRGGRALRGYGEVVRTGSGFVRGDA